MSSINVPHRTLLSLIFIISITAFGYCQKKISMSEAEYKREVSMSNSVGKNIDGVYRYYAKGENKPFTGVLFAKYPNGNYASWQQYKEGIGQGKWINYYENGNFKEVGYYNENRVEGPIKKYYKNGNLKAEGHYKDWRIRIGRWRYYDEHGNLKTTKDYGKKGTIEEVEQYYKRGDIPFSWYADILTKNGFKEKISKQN